MPQLLSLEPSLGRALPTASPEIRNHVIYVDIMRRALSIESEGDPIQTLGTKTGEGGCLNGCQAISPKKTG